MPDTTETRNQTGASFTADQDEFLILSRDPISPEGDGLRDLSVLAYLKQGADRGEAEWQFYLGLTYFLESEPQRRRDEALALFRKAADNNYPEAFFCLGLIHKEGDPELRDSGKSKGFFKKAAAHGLCEDRNNRRGFSWNSNTDPLREKELGYAVLRLRGANKKFGS
jgi:hypothetical protein